MLNPTLYVSVCLHVHVCVCMCICVSLCNVEMFNEQMYVLLCSFLFVEYIPICLSGDSFKKFGIFGEKD